MSPTNPTKLETMQAIMRLNPTAAPDFLADFTREELSLYLSRLQSVAEVPRPATPSKSGGNHPHGYAA